MILSYSPGEEKQDLNFLKKQSILKYIFFSGGIFIINIFFAVFFATAFLFTKDKKTKTIALLFFIINSGTVLWVRYLQNPSTFVVEISPLIWLMVFLLVGYKILDFLEKKEEGRAINVKSE